MQDGQKKTYEKPIVTKQGVLARTTANAQGSDPI